MELRYDEKAGDLYLRLSEGRVLDSEEVHPGIVLDFDSNSQVVGIEVLRLQRRGLNGDPKP